MRPASAQNPEGFMEASRDQNPEIYAAVGLPKSGGV